MGQGDSRLQFKARINQLGEKTIAANDHEFWSVLFTSPLSVDDIYALISPSDIRDLRKKHPENLATVIYKSIEQLFLFSQPANFMSESTSAKNSLHLLSRILPFVFENNEDCFVDLLFFENLVPSRMPTQLLNELKQINAQYNQDKSSTLNHQQNEQLEPTSPFESQHKKEEKPVQSTLAEQKTEENPPQAVEVAPTQQPEPVEQEQEKVKAESPKVVVETVKPPTTQTQQPSPRQEQQQQGGKKKKKNKNKKQTSQSKEQAEPEPQQPEPQEEKKQAIVEENVPVQEEVQPVEELVLQQPVQKEQTQQEANVEESKTQVSTTSPQVTYDLYKQGLRTITHLADERLQTPLATALITTLMRVLFIPGFSIPLAQTKSKKEIVSNELDINFLWERGLGDRTGKYAPSYEQLDNRNDTLKCLISTFSGVLYLHSDDCNRIENKFLTIATTCKINTKTLLYSLLNMVLNYDPRGYMPYTTQVFTSYAEKYIEMALHVACLLLHHKPQQGTNVYVEHVRNITDEVDFKFIYQGITLNLNNVIASNNTYLPNSQRLISFYEELLVLTWKLLSENPTFRVYACRDEDISQLLTPLLYLIQSHSTDQSKFPVVQMAAFTLLLLSGHREFGVALNKPFTQKVPIELPIFSGNYADFLIILFHKVMVTDKGIIRPLYDCLLTIIANISPYTKSLSLVASVKLLNLFEAFSSAKFLYSSEKNHTFVSLLLEVFNNLIQYQYEGNTHLVYAILRRKKAFRELEKDYLLDEIREGILKRQKNKTSNSSESAFLPSEEWVKTWKPFLPLQTVKSLLNILTPEVEKLCAKELATEDDVLDYLRKTTLVGLLPVPHTIIIRTFQTNPRIDIFLTTYLWGLIYLKSLVPPSFDANSIKLFQVNVVE